MKTYLITGCYGFLGYSTAIRLLEQGHRVIGLDRLVDAKSEKGPRVAMLRREPKFEFYETDISNWDQVMTLFKLAKPDEVMHFAAQYSVPASTKAAQAYAKSNLHGFINMIAATHEVGRKRFHYASSTFVEEGFRPTSMYGATKQFNEDWANVYSLQGMTTVGIRYGSTFGPWCRADVGIYTQTKRILTGAKMKVTSPFQYQTAFLYRDDAVEGTLRILAAENLTGHNTFTLVADDHRLDMGQVVEYLELVLGKKANIDWEGYTPKLSNSGGIPRAQLEKLQSAIGWIPEVKMPDAIRRFAKWAEGRHAEGKL